MQQIKERLARCLSILRRLQLGPLDRGQLLAHVAAEVDPDAYTGRTGRPSLRIFEKDMEFLRTVLAVDLPGYDRANQVYEFKGFGSFRPLALGEQEMDGLAFLSETFGPGTPNATQVQALLRRVQSLMSSSQTEALQNRRQQLQLDLKQTDSDPVDPRVERAVQAALSSRRCLQFSYLASSQGDGIPRLHTVQPWNRYFDPVNGHHYLDAYRLRVDGPKGSWEEGRWVAPYRLGRIRADEHLRVLPDRLPPEPPKRPVYRLAYRLSPQIARRGISQLFDDTYLDPPAPDGWQLVHAQTHDLFRACRLLLSYGPGCQVVGGPEAQREMKTLVDGLAQLYAET